MFKAGVKYSFNILKVLFFFLGYDNLNGLVSTAQTLKVPAIGSNIDPLKPSLVFNANCPSSPEQLAPFHPFRVFLHCSMERGMHLCLAF